MVRDARYPNDAQTKVVKRTVESNAFWERLSGGIDVLHPVADAIYRVEGDSVNCADAYFVLKGLDRHFTSVSSRVIILHIVILVESHHGSIISNSCRVCSWCSRMTCLCVCVGCCCW